MDKKYSLYNYQSIIATLKEKSDREDEYYKLLEGIGEDSIIEDMPFYKDYLVRFDVEQAFDGLKLVAEEETEASRDDLFLLFRLIVASFSSSYNILFDKSSNSIDLSITVSNDELTVTKSVAELWTFQIEVLYENYIAEQANLYACYTDPEYTDEIVSEQKMKLMVFEKKIRQLREMQGCDEILSDMDDLLKS